MKLNISKSKISILLIIIIFSPIFSVISNSGINTSNSLNLGRLKLSDETDSPLISNLVVSDPNLELLNTQTITCIVTDASVISSVYSVIWFGDDTFIAECNMINSGGDVYQCSWNSLDAALGEYIVNVLAEDQFENLAKATTNFTIIDKPNIYVESVSPIGSHTTLGPNSIADYLQPDDSEQFQLDGQFDNGASALYSTPDIPWYSAQGVDSAPSGWSAATDGSSFSFGTTTAGAVASACETRPVFDSQRSLYNEYGIHDIQIHIRVQPFGMSVNPTLRVFIYNYHLGSWETLSDAVRTTNVWIDLYFNKANLDDSNLEHYLDTNGKIQLRIYDWAQFVVIAWLPNFALGVLLAWLFPIPVYASQAHLAIDQCNVRVLYRHDQEINLEFQPDVLDGANDYYLYFNGQTDDGTAQLNVDGLNIFDITNDITTKGDIMKFPIHDANEITITGNFKSLNIDYFYLEQLRDEIPPLQWKSHDDGDYVIFEDALDGIMKFEYSGLDGIYDEVKLELLENEYITSAGQNEIDVSSIRSTLIETGLVEAKLVGYKDGSIINSDNYNKVLEFVEVSKVIEDQVVDSGTEDLGDKLYLIIHDPHGDQSFSSFTETSTISIGTKFSITAGISAGLEVGFEEELFGIGVEGSASIDLSFECEETYDFRYEVTNILFLTSMLETDNPDIIGPGYGDRYWGERWWINWELIVDRVLLSNGDDVYLEPKMVYGISRTSETWENDFYAPSEWKLLNPAHTGYQPEDVEWRSSLSGHGGLSSYTSTDIVTTSKTHSLSISMSISTEVRAKLGYAGVYVEASFGASLSTTNYAESTLSHSIEASYSIGDDEVDDYMHMDIGVDKNFGTYIFRTFPDAVSSDPIEYYI